MFKKALTAVTIATVAATSIFATAAPVQNNPLHPSYYQEKAANWVQTKATGNTERYVDVRNPLSPSYNRAGDANWMVTSDVNFVAYVDRFNPLSPSYKR